MLKALINKSSTILYTSHLLVVNMDLSSLVIATLVASPSGALSPGPLTLATLAIGSRSGWRGGFLVAIGHMAIELPYVLALFFFMNYITQLLKGLLGDVITVLGVLTISFFAAMIIKDSLKGASNRDPGESIRAANPVVVGALFTGLNIYFLLWWLSIGLGLISMTSSLGVTAIAVMYLSHVWMDYLWLITVAEASKRGLRILRGRAYSLLLLMLGALLLLFGVNTALTRFAGVSIIP